MSRSKNSTERRGEARDRARERMAETRRAERKAHAKAMRLGTPEARREYLAAVDVAQSAQDEYEALSRRDTGWEAMRTSFGIRYHREIGSTIQIDVERQVTTWMGSIVRMGVLRAVIRDADTAADAARAIEAKATELFRDGNIMVEARPLPSSPEF